MQSHSLLTLCGSVQAQCVTVRVSGGEGGFCRMRNEETASKTARASLPLSEHWLPGAG